MKKGMPLPLMIGPDDFYNIEPKDLQARKRIKNKTEGKGWVKEKNVKI